jgi:UDP:flavonoid glycosyltransferase YjiC (YdhE family)
MNITIATVGSRGDIQPYVALGRGIQAAGHLVQLAADLEFETFIRGHGLGFAPVTADPRQALEEDIRQIGNNPIRLFNWIKRNLKPVAQQYVVDIKQACQGSDGILYSTLAFLSYHVAEALQVPSVAAFLQPFTPTRAFSNPVAANIPPWLPFQGEFNWLSFRLNNLISYRMFKGMADDCRREILDLPPVPWRVYESLDISEMPIIYGYSPHVIPKPTDWDGHKHVTGYWFLQTIDKWQPPVELSRFLEAGSPPIYVGFGSMVDREAETLTELVVDALQQAGRRGILLGGWSELGGRGLPDNVLKVSEVPHDWLFPRVAAVVHHGGAGTTAAGLRAGVPAVIVPFFADQPFWGRQVYQLGVGPQPVPRKRLTAERLAEAIRMAVGDEALRRRASELGRKIRTEDGVAKAVELIEHYFSTCQERSSKDLKGLLTGKERLKQ